MRSFLEYYNETKNICISNYIFESGGFNTYFQSYEDCIEFYKDNTSIFSKYNVDTTIIKQLYDICQDIPFTIDVDNKEIKLRRFFSEDSSLREKILEYGEFTLGDRNFIFKGSKINMKVGDGGLSKKAKSGVNTEKQELMFCDVVNNNGYIDFDNLLEKYKLDDSFKISAKYQFEKLKKYVTNISDYCAYRPANIDKESKNIKQLHKLFDKIISYKSIFNGSLKSYITPADVFIVKKSEITDITNTFENIISKFDKCISETGDRECRDVAFTDCKTIFVTLLNKKSFIPVSLKKITKSNISNKIEELNIKKYDIAIDTKNYELRFIDSGFVGEFTTNHNENIKFNFRSNQKTIYPLSFEFNKKGDGGATGKFKTFVENYVEINTIDLELPSIKDFYEKYKNNKNFNLKTFYKEKISLYKSNPTFNFIVDDSKYNDEKLSKIEENDKSFYILVVCLLFVEFLFNLYNSSKNLENNEFFTFVKDCYMAAKKITDYSLPYILIK